MGRPPAYLFVVRHGYRLDAADKQWHLSSPAPYDPPLTYGGWQQAKSLGARIASILHERVHEEERAAGQNADPSAERKRKRYEVVLHSSPFLRCIQTSIAISAGLAQDSTPFRPATSPAALTTPAPGVRPRPIVVTDVRDTATPSASVKIRKSLLRLDAFLGEWLSPSYFEFITPPPESVMMLASAKADLLRRGDYSQYSNFTSHTHSNAQGQLWSPATRTTSASSSNDGLSSSLGSMGGLATSLPTGLNGSGRSDLATRGQQAESAVSGYVSPVPHYAVNNNNTIPAGYVSHARDACVAIDYQWDSTRGSLDWGDGGTFPEEWAAMHTRFRAGVQSLVDWYSKAEDPTRPVTKTAAAGASNESSGGFLDWDDDMETEAVVILVTHGAGCNALIGAITHQPALMDVGMASLTMAIRKPSTANPRSCRDAPPIHELYDLKLFANTDHLRSPVATPTSSRSPSISSALNIARGRHSSFSSPMSGFSWNDGHGSRSSSANAVSGRRRTGSNNGPAIPRLSFAVSTGGITVGSGVTSFASTRPSNLGRSGLWSPLSSRFEDEEEEEEDDDDDDDVMLLNFSHEKSAAPVSTSKPAPFPEARRGDSPSMNNGNAATGGSTERGTDAHSGRSPNPEPKQLGAGAGGLWGAPRPPDDADRFRDISSSKRRWTVTERS